MKMKQPKVESMIQNMLGNSPKSDQEKRNSEKIGNTHTDTTNLISWIPSSRNPPVRLIRFLGENKNQKKKKGKIQKNFKDRGVVRTVTVFNKIKYSQFHTEVSN